MSAVTSSVVSATTSSVRQTITRHFWELGSDVKLDPKFLERQRQGREEILAVLTPLNLTILALVITVLYLRSRSTSALTLDATRPITFRSFTPRILLKYNGTKSTLNPDALVYLAVKGKVYDVSSSRNFYGPGGSYENFAGRDATRGLACQSFEADMLTQNLDGPLDPCEDLTADQRENLRGWEERFDEKYLIVGKLVAFGKGAF